MDRSGSAADFLLFPAYEKVSGPPPGSLRTCSASYETPSYAASASFVLPFCENTIQLACLPLMEYGTEQIGVDIPDDPPQQAQRASNAGNQLHPPVTRMTIAPALLRQNFPEFPRRHACFALKHFREKKRGGEPAIYAAGSDGLKQKVPALPGLFDLHFPTGPQISSTWTSTSWPHSQERMIPSIMAWL